MLTLTNSHVVRTLAFALVMAMGGFCYATSTGKQAAVSRSFTVGQGRAIGSTAMRFTNPLTTPGVPNDYDLGDACFGSVVQRYITVTGGIRPYHISGIINGITSISIMQSGCVMGSVTSSTSPILTLITATDSASTQPQSIQSTFRLTMLACTANTFQFAVNNINDGVVGLSYISKIETVGGALPVVFSILPNTLTLNGVPVGVNAALEAVGLTMSTDGTITGRPLMAGQVQFKVRATDQSNRIAGARFGGGQDQVITLNIQANSLTSTDFTTLTCKVQGDVGRVGKDTITFTGLINLGGQPLRNLFNTEFEFRVGAAAFDGRFNVLGKVVNVNGGPVVFADGSKMTANVDSRSGLVKGKITHATVGRAVNALNLPDRSTQRLGVGMLLCGFVIASDMIEFATHKVGDKFTLEYQLGKVGQPLGGAFQVTSVQGIDALDIAGEPASKWSIRFLAVPRFGVDPTPGFDAVSTVGIRIGTNFNQRISAAQLTSNKKGDIKLIGKQPDGASVSKFSFSASKFEGLIQTNALATIFTGMLQARVAGGGSANFMLGFDLARTGSNSPYTGENSKVIITNAKHNRWMDRTK